MFTLLRFYIFIAALLSVPVLKAACTVQFDPLQRKLVCVQSAGSSAAVGYVFTVTAQTTVVKTAATHGQGTFPSVGCWNSTDGEEVTPKKTNPGLLGDITLEFYPAFTGNCYIRGPGVDSGAVPNVMAGASLASDLPLVGAGTTMVATGTKSGNTTQFVTTSGAQTANRCVEIDASGNHIAAAAACATSTAAYEFNVVAQTTVTTTLATHGQGTFPHISCWNTVDGEEVAARKTNPSFAGNITIEFSSAFTGKCAIRR